jgi:hypothetical protein
VHAACAVNNKLRVGLYVPLAGHEQAAASERPALPCLRVRRAVVGVHSCAATPQNDRLVESRKGFLACDC